ncbi:MAG: ABC transporter ATP-binding protein [Desulfotalea sp.]
MNTKQTALCLKNISKSFGSLKANDDITLSLSKGEILSLLGENGAGKTTLMNILFGHYLADSGSIEIFGKKLPTGSPQAALESGVGMVHQHFTLADNMTVLDNITLGTEPLYSLFRKKAVAIQKITSLAKKFGLEVEPMVKIKSLSIGQQQRVEILKALYRDVKILILDEPTAVLTPQESDQLFETLRLLVHEGLAVIFITHKLQEVMSASDRCVVLRHGKVVHECATANTDATSLAEAMVGGTIPKTHKKKNKQGDRLLQLKGICLGGQSCVDMSLFKGQILGVAGVSGNGQQRLASYLSGVLRASSGKSYFSGKEIKKINPKKMLFSGIGRIPEDRNSTGVVGDMSVGENIVIEDYRDKRFNLFGFLRFKQIKEQSKRLINKFDIRCPGSSAITRQLSGGNMQKLILARVLDKKPNLIVASQPTWGLDVGASAFVHQQLIEARDKGAAVLLITEDLDELFKMADKIQVIYKGQLSPLIEPEKVDAATLGLAMSGHNIKDARRDKV